MNEIDYFSEYQQVKIAINKLICQFYDYRLDKEEAELLNIDYFDNSPVTSRGSLLCVYHRYEPEGLYLWEKLGIKEPIVLVDKLWDLRQMPEDKKEDIDYYRETLELKTIVAYMVNRYYSTEVDLEDFKKHNIEYFDEFDLDEETGKVSVCSHYFESAGESSFYVLGIEDSLIPLSSMYKIISDLEQELLEYDQGKVKKIGVK